GFARAADDTDKLQKKYREPISELDKPSGTMFLKFMKKQLPDREMSFYAFAGFGNTPDDVRAANAKIKPFIVGDIDELEYNINKIFRDVDFVGVEKMVVDARNVPDGMMPDVEALVDLDDRLEFYTDDSDDDEEDGGGGKMQHYVIGPDGKKRKVPVPGKPSAQVAGSSHNTPVQPKTYKYTLQRTELMPKLRDMGFKFQGNQIILSKQQRDQLVQKLGSQFQSIFSQSDKFTETGNQRDKRNPTRDFLRRYPVPQDQMAKPVKKPEKKKPEQGVAEGSLDTDNMVPHIGQVIQSIYPRGGDKNTYMKLVAQQMPHVVRDHSKLFRRAFGMAYDRFFNIDQDDNQDDDFDYTDYSMRQGERGMEEGKIKGVDGKACWKGKRYAGKIKKADGTYKDKCVPVGEDAYSESLMNQLNSIISEKAPPGDKYERMVKHIKKGYAKDGKITDKERSIAYATAWKAKNKAKK
ncbi:MAG: hypothetical protein ACO222_06925, partial [Polynucleobacter sp.]